VQIEGDRHKRVIKLILSLLFWAQLTELEEIISPIHERQKQAETDRSHVGYVRGRWDEIWLHLKRCEKVSSAGLWSSHWPELEARKKRQLTDIHLLTHWLMPSNVVNSRMEPGTFSLSSLEHN
jgi:hypothetical protein